MLTIGRSLCCKRSTHEIYPLYDSIGDVSSAPSVRKIYGKSDMLVVQVVVGFYATDSWYDSSTNSERHLIIDQPKLHTYPRSSIFY
jgi:hypothetical protein